MRKALYILSVLSDADIHWLVTVGRRRDLAAREVVIKSGVAIDALFICVDGELSVTLGDRQPRELARLGIGEVLGEISYLDSRPPLTSVTAIGPAAVFAIPRAALTHKLQNDDGFAARFYKAVGSFLAHRLRETTASLGYSSGSIQPGEISDVDELPEELMEGVSLGGARFNWILERLRGK